MDLKMKRVKQLFVLIKCVCSSDIDIYLRYRILNLIEYTYIYVDMIHDNGEKLNFKIICELYRACLTYMQGDLKSAMKHSKVVHKMLRATELTGIRWDDIDLPYYDDYFYYV